MWRARQGKLPPSLHRLSGVVEELGKRLCLNQLYVVLAGIGPGIVGDRTERHI